MQHRSPARTPVRSLDLAEPLDLATEEDIPELDTSSGEDLEGLELAALEDDVFGDSDGNDYRAGTMDPDGSDRGPYDRLSLDRLEDVQLSRRH